VRSGAQLTRRSAIVALGLLASPVSCGFKENIAGAGKTEERIRRELGVDARVGFRTVNSVTNVTVTLQALPALSPPLARARVEAIVRAEMTGVSTIEVLAKL